MKYLLCHSAFLGFTVTLALFVLCFVVVIGIKAIIYYVQSLFPEKREKISAPKRQRKVRAKTVKPIKSIEINPDEIDRIYVKKIS
jgi:hypothetical protein